MAAAGPGAVIAAWGNLGYPRRARRLWEAAVAITEHGWPDDLAELPGIGRYTAAAIAAQADDDGRSRDRSEHAAGRRAGARAPAHDDRGGSSDARDRTARCAGVTGCSR